MKKSARKVVSESFWDNIDKRQKKFGDIHDKPVCSIPALSICENFLACLKLYDPEYIADFIREVNDKQVIVDIFAPSFRKSSRTKFGSQHKSNSTAKDKGSQLSYEVSSTPITENAILQKIKLNKRMFLGNTPEN